MTAPRRMTIREASRAWGYPPPLVAVLRVFFPWLFDRDAR